MRRSFRNPFYKTTPLEDAKLASKGSQAESIQRALAPVLGQEADNIIRQLSTAKPDLGTYAHLAGQAFVITKILNHASITLEQAREAAERLRKTGT